MALIGALGNAELDRYARAHREVIARFGRFPHRNAALGRTSTPDEQAWLDAQIAANGQVDAYDRALLDFIEQE